MRMTKGRKSPHVAKGGPYDGRTLWLTTAGTLAFRVPSFDKRSGYYDKDGNWNFVQ